MFSVEGTANRAWANSSRATSPLAAALGRAASDPGGQGGRVGVAVAGDEAGDLDGLLALLRDCAAQLRDLGGAVELDPGRGQHGLDGAQGYATIALTVRGVLSSGPMEAW